MVPVFKVLTVLVMIIGIVVVLIPVLELVSLGIWKLFIEDSLAKLDARAYYPPYDNFEDKEEFFKEKGDLVANNYTSGQQYQPFYLWSEKESSGKWHNIKANGDRVTFFNLEGDDKAGAIRVFTFGGSTMWGAGSPDDATIPSWLAKFLNEGEGKYVVENMGQNGHVSSQELIRLILELRNGNIPDIVVFLDGGNDAACALRPGNPYAHLNYNHVAATFSFNPSYYVNLVSGRPYIRRLTNHVVNKLSKGKHKTVSSLTPVSESKVKMVEKNAPVSADVWINNTIFIKKLSEIYGFKAICILQPVLYTRKEPLLPYERELWERDPVAKVSYGLVFPEFRKKLQEGDYPWVYDLTDIFDGTGVPAFIDAIHYGPGGNEVIARRIRDIINSN